MLLFKTSFEPPIVFVDGTFPKEYLKGGQWIPYPELGWNHMIHQHGTHDVDIDYNFDPTIKHSGTQSLHLTKHIKGVGAVRFSLFGNDVSPEPTRLKTDKLFIRRWVYLPSDLKLTPDAENQSWLGLSGYRERRAGGEDFTVGLDIGDDGNGFYWSARGVLYNPWTSIWNKISRAIPLPVGRWFKFEEYIERHPITGVYKVWIDGRLLFDLNGVPTKMDSDSMWIRSFMMMGSCDESCFPLDVWVDDLEIWDELPPIGGPLTAILASSLFAASLIASAV